MTGESAASGAEFELRPSGWPPLSCGRLAVLFLLLAPALCLTCLGAEVPLPGSLGSVEVPVIVPLVAVLVVWEAWRAFRYRTRHFVVTSQSLTVVGAGLLPRAEPEARGLVERAHAERVALVGSDVHIARGGPTLLGGGTDCVVAGGGVALFETLERLWPGVPCTREAAPRAAPSGRRSLWLLGIVGVLAVLTSVDGVLVRRGHLETADLVAALERDWDRVGEETAAALTSSVGATRPGIRFDVSLARPSDLGGGFGDPRGTFYLHVTSSRQGETSEVWVNADVSSSTGPWGSPMFRVTVDPDGDPGDAVFLEKLEQGLARSNRARVSYSITLKRRSR